MIYQIKKEYANDATSEHLKWWNIYYAHIYIKFRPNITAWMWTVMLVTEVTMHLTFCNLKVVPCLVDNWNGWTVALYPLNCSNETYIYLFCRVPVSKASKLVDIRYGGRPDQSNSTWAIFVRMMIWDTLIWQSLTPWGRDKMAGIFQTTFSNVFSWMKIFEFRLEFHWSLFVRFQLTINQHWSRSWLGA